MGEVNPSQSMVVRDVTFTVENEARLESRDLILAEYQPQTVNVPVSGKRNILGALNRSGVQAIIDVGELKEGVNTVAIRYELPDGIYLGTHTTDSVQVTVEKIISREVPVQVTMQGDLATDYIYDSMTTTPQSVVVNGRRSAVEKLDHLAALVDVSGWSADRSTNVPLTTADEAGNVVSDVSLNISSVNISVFVRKTKEVPVEVRRRGELPENVSILKIETAPAHILVKGKSDQIDEMTSLLTVELDQSKITGNLNQPIELSFPSGIEAVNGEKQVQLTVQVEKQEDRVVEIPVSQIDLLDVPAGLKAAFTQTSPVKVTLRGFPSQLNALDKKKVKGSVSLADQIVGQKSVLPSIVVPEGFSVVQVSLMTVEVTGTGTESNGL